MNVDHIVGSICYFYNYRRIYSTLLPYYQIRECDPKVMLTGVEIAGLALATFPIAVDGLRRMVEGVETIRYWRRYRVKLEDYACDLEAARVYYLDTLEELLMGIVESDAELAVLINEPGGIAWRKPEYEGSLRRRLDRSYDTYLHILNRMRNALIEMREKLGFDESGKVSGL